MSNFQTLRVFTDGGSRGNPGTAGIGVHVVDQSDFTIFDHHEYIGETTNNVAEYKGLLSALTWLEKFSKDNKVERVEFYMDSNLVVEQINKNWKIKQDHLAELAFKIWAKLEKISIPYKLSHVRREKNKVADQLANLAMDSAHS
ncbi:MAG: ribonuclease HI family protein [Candidatus Pacebacteria bacterium]|nr:ribonuclease HI family protein [Candidatus Paceibacterota bacterium]